MDFLTASLDTDDVVLHSIGLLVSMEQIIKQNCSYCIYILITHTHIYIYKYMEGHHRHNDVTDMHVVSS